MASDPTPLFSPTAAYLLPSPRSHLPGGAAVADDGAEVVALIGGDGEAGGHLPLVTLIQALLDELAHEERVDTRVGHVLQLTTPESV